MIKLKLSDMKKVKVDKHHTTMKTPEGHSILIKHSSLSKPHRKALEALPFADGGEVSSDDDIIKEKETTDEYNRLHEDEPKEYSPKVQKRMSETDVTPRKMASGGQADPTQRHLMPGDAIPNKIEKQVVNTAKNRVADGGEVADSPDNIAPSTDDSQSIPIASSPQALGQSISPIDQQSGQSMSQSPISGQNVSQFSPSDQSTPTKDQAQQPTPPG